MSGQKKNYEKITMQMFVIVLVWCVPQLVRAALPSVGLTLVGVKQAV